jgi:hypothetical protein
MARLFLARSRISMPAGGRGEGGRRRQGSGSGWFGRCWRATPRHPVVAPSSWRASSPGAAPPSQAQLQLQPKPQRPSRPSAQPPPTRRLELALLLQRRQPPRLLHLLLARLALGLLAARVGQARARLAQHLLLVVVHVHGVGPRRLGLGVGVDLACGGGSRGARGRSGVGTGSRVARVPGAPHPPARLPCPRGPPAHLGAAGAGRPPGRTSRPC